ncbi:MAG: Rho termination factor N-terminal domain-containing protein, partial [Bacilli bacterium]|nr:Rho termination factor N-terminal domain-containing protein [Bacilli bacterium]
KMTVAELKEVAAAKNVDVAGMKKAEIIEALTK